MIDRFNQLDNLGSGNKNGGITVQRNQANVSIVLVEHQLHLG